MGVWVTKVRYAGKKGIAFAVGFQCLEVARSGEVLARLLRNEVGVVGAESAVEENHSSGGLGLGFGP